MQYLLTVYPYVKFNMWTHTPLTSENQQIPRTHAMEIQQTIVNSIRNLIFKKLMKNIGSSKMLFYQYFLQAIKNNFKTRFFKFYLI